MRGIGFLLLIFGFICGSVCLDPSLTPSRHKLFVKTVRANSTLTYYQHRLAVNHIAQIPCFVSSSDVDINATDPVAFEWLLNGRQILPHLSFIHGHWDLDGTLTILAAMPRQYTLWCHVRLGDETDDQDFYFAHQIKFFQEPVRLLIIGVLVNMTMDEESWDRKCLHEKFTCDCRRYAGWNATQWFSSGLKNHYVRRVVNDLAMDTCDTFAFCQTVSLDNFECVNVEHDLNASHFLEFSFFIDGGKQYLANDSLTYLSGEHIFQMLYQNFTIGTENLRGILHQETGNLYYSTNLQVDVSVFKRYYTFCMGYASTLNRETDECELCPSGSFANPRLINPRPPYTTLSYKPLLSDIPYLSDQHAEKALLPQWLDTDEKSVCLSCPVNTYSEESGRPLCLPCPVWHMRPESQQSGKELHLGAHWLHLACPKEGRNELRLVQVAEGMLGTRFANWVKHSNPLSRVGALVVLFLVPLAVALILMFVAYMLIDVGAVIVKMARELHPLQIQIAEMTTATASFKAQHQKATDEVYARMRGE